MELTIEEGLYIRAVNFANYSETDRDREGKNQQYKTVTKYFDELNMGTVAEKMPALIYS